MAHNTLWSLVGKIVPMLGALVSIPILIKALGTDRFGVLTLAWILVGYFSLFDLGLSRALTYFVARKEGAGQQEDLLSMIWTALILMCGLGVFGAIVMAGLEPAACRAPAQSACRHSTRNPVVVLSTVPLAAVGDCCGRVEGLASGATSV